MKITSYRVYIRLGGPGPSIEVQWFVQSAFFMANFFLSVLCVKTGEVEVNY